VPKPTQIAIDGPASSGKTTVGKGLAERLGYLFFDTGLMYRAATLVVLEHGIDPAEEAAVVALTKRAEIDVRPPSIEDGRHVDVHLDSRDVTWQLHSPEVDAKVSLVSSYRGVREALTARQREIGQRQPVVMVGRDIGTVVLPEAGLKIYLDATVEERARRRYEERLARGQEASYATTLEAMRERDAFDSTRDLAPLCKAADAVVIDTTEMTLQQVVASAMELVEAADP
jgi:cytidylate kinase